MKYTKRRLNDSAAHGYRCRNRSRSSSGSPCKRALTVTSNLGFGRIVASKIEAPNILVPMV